MSNTEINNKLKDIIKNDKFFINLFKTYGNDEKSITNLSFECKKLDGRNAQSDGDKIIFNEKLFKNGLEYFVNNHLHFLAHEIYHWICRQNESKYYFADPEEKEAFSYGMAYEIIRGKNTKEIAEIYYPIIAEHFKNEEAAIDMFFNLYDMAKQKAEKIR